jgi:hypothetical protein
MKNNERKFVDLIFRNNRGKYANLDPTAPIAVGDFGYVAKKSGRFLKEGNIFKDNIVAVSQIEVPSPGGRIDLKTLTAEGTKSLKIDGTIGRLVASFFIQANFLTALPATSPALWSAPSKLVTAFLQVPVRPLLCLTQL